MLLRPGDVLEGELDTYQIVAPIGRGAYGCAFRARASDGHWRVVKQFEPNQALPDADISYQRQCFEREAAILLRFTGPAMVRGFELIENGGDLHLVMEHVQGLSLRAALDDQLRRRGRPFDAGTTIAIGHQLCAAIEALHQLEGQVIYRDLKPDNVMWDGVARRLKLIDFGTARFNADARPATCGLGTEGYAPPELYGSGQALTFATDVYTLGAVLYELCTGAVPPARQTPTDFRGFEEALPAGLRAALLTALQQAPEARHASAAALGLALADAGVPPFEPPLRHQPGNLHPLLACRCPLCGREPTRETAVYCGYDGAMYQVAFLRLVPRHRPAATLYLDRAQMVLGRADPTTEWYPEVDLAPHDPGRHVSRRHATLRRAGATYELTAHAAVNQTRLDGQVVPPEQTVSVAPGSRIELADLVAAVVHQPVLDVPIGVTT